MTSLRKRLTRRKDRRRLYEARHRRRDVSGNTSSEHVSELDGTNTLRDNAATRKTHTTVEDTATLISKLQTHLKKIKNEHRRVKYHIYHGHIDNYSTNNADVSYFPEPEGTPMYPEEQQQAPM